MHLKKLYQYTHTHTHTHIHTHTHTHTRLHTHTRTHTHTHTHTRARALTHTQNTHTTHIPLWSYFSNFPRPTCINVSPVACNVCLNESATIITTPLRTISRFEGFLQQSMIHCTRTKHTQQYTTDTRPPDPCP
jgi:hypothetical protein